MSTKKFRTRTETIARKNGNIPDVWEIALDLGYSAVKLFSPNKVACFPSYAKRVNTDLQFAGGIPKESILYRNLDTDEMWVIGAIAQNLISTGDTSDSESSLYGRERYNNPMFYVIMEAGLGIAMHENAYGSPGNSKIVVQTGLPERYMADEPYLKDVIAGPHNFALKIGSGDWIVFRFTISKDDVYVMSQPKGTLFSVCIGKDGKFHPDADKYLSSSVLIFDPGFGTFDIFPIMSGVVKEGETFTDLGMKRIFQETSKLIQENFNVDVPVPAMQKPLETGIVRYVDPKEFRSDEYDFTSLLVQANEKICKEAISRMAASFKLIDYNYLIVTGGTGAAWFDIIKEKFKNFSTLKILQGNQNDDLPFIYSNVRGYYLYRFNILGKELRKK